MSLFNSATPPIVGLLKRGQFGALWDIFVDLHGYWADSTRGKRNSRGAVGLTPKGKVYDAAKYSTEFRSQGRIIEPQTIEISVELEKFYLRFWRC